MAASALLGWASVTVIVLLIAVELRFVRVAFHAVVSGGRPAVAAARLNDPHRRAVLRRLKFRAAACAVGLMLGFAVAEAGFRILGIRPDPIPHPQHEDEARVDNSVNALGFREPWGEIAADDPRLRIAVLGDSNVYGHSVERDEAFCHLLEERLAEDVPHGVLTINLGYPGSGPPEQLQKFLPLRDTLQPDVVVHVLFPNDLMIPLHGRLIRIYRIRDQRWWRWTSSWVVGYIEEQIRYWLAWRETLDYFRGGRDSAEREASWARLEEDVRGCKQAAEEVGAQYAIVMLPWLVRLEDYPLEDIHKRMAAFAEELGVPYVDLLTVFRGGSGAALRVSTANEHPNQRAHRIIAENLAAFLRANVIPQVTSQPDPVPGTARSEG